MKKRDAVVISAYTGELCCDFKDVQKYVEEVTDKKITKQDYENENIIESLKEYIKPDFVATCDNLSSEEAAVITIHTDTVCCNFDYAQKYADRLLGESTWTHDFADKKLVAKLKELSKSDFIKIFENLTDE
nr:MAG TPA: hypothetical protein [Caudoviricetes sp.]